jgi:uncharacterized protein YfaS (alpha-2-macroglobulin family)
VIFLPGMPIGEPFFALFGGAVEIVEPTNIMIIATSYQNSDSPIPVFDKGDTVRINATFRDSGTLELVDPGSITFRLRKPGGAVTMDTSPVQDGVGQYYVDLNADTEGTWSFRWEVSSGREEGEFVVRATSMD